MSDVTNHLQALIAATNSALISLRRTRAVRCSANWGDLNCIDAEKVEDSRGRTSYRVIISEADPINDDMHKYIAQVLEDAGLPKIDVVTEW